MPKNLSDQEAIYIKSEDTGIAGYDRYMPTGSVIKIRPTSLDGATEDLRLAFKVAQKGEPSINKTVYCCIKSGQAVVRLKLFTQMFRRAHTLQGSDIVMRSNDTIVTGPFGPFLSLSCK